MQYTADLRSDTVTRPTPAMLHAMQTAQLGDDVLEGDPTTQRLEHTIANMLGKQAALFVTSGTMANQIAVRLHCGRDTEIICESGCHIYNYEQAGYAQLSGVAANPIAGIRGEMTVGQVIAAIRPDDTHFPKTALVAIENTHNRAGGRVLSQPTIDTICEAAHQRDLKTHLDGARLFNASIASGNPADQLAAPFDSVSVCFSKGLGAPAGSALCGSPEFIAKARRVRKMLGGGMRQSGLLAACALHALEHHIPGLSQDHQHARQLADIIAGCPNLTLLDTPETNIVIFEVARSLGSSADFCSQLATHSVGALPFGPEVVRLVTHRDVSQDQITQACEAIVASQKQLTS